MKTFSISILSLVIVAIAFGFKTPFQKAALKKIIIDAGHGGHDVGARGRYSSEKDVSLAVAIKLGEELKSQLRDVEIILTRTTDIFHSPPTKANIANYNKGDLFVSIHCNSAPAIRHSELVRYRTETYYTGKGKRKKKHTRKVP